MDLTLCYPRLRVAYRPAENPVLRVAESSSPFVNTDPVNTGQVALHAHHFSLVPDRLFDPEARIAYLTHLGMDEGTPVGVVAIPEWQAQLIYSQEHTSLLNGDAQPTSLWRGLLAQAQRHATGDQETALFLHYTPGQIYMVAVQETALQFFNTHPVEESTDVLYFMLAALEQWGQSPRTTPIRVSGQVVEGSPLLQLLEEYLGEVGFVIPDVAPQFGPEVQAHPSQYADLVSFVTCESSAEV